MILKSYPSLGIFPEVLVAIFLVGVMTMGGLVMWKVAHCPPVAMVPSASGVGEVSVAKPDQKYAESLARGFLLQWYLWTQNNQPYRRTQAIKLLSVAAQPRFQSEISTKGAMVDILAQASTIDIHSLSADPMPKVAGAWLVTFKGTIKSYYGGMGGDPEDVAGVMMLTNCIPTNERPICLEINGIKMNSSAKKTERDALGDLMVPMNTSALPVPPASVPDSGKKDTP